MPDAINIMEALVNRFVLSGQVPRVSGICP